MNRTLVPIVFLLVVLAAWEILHEALGMNSIILPAPSEIGTALAEDWNRIIAEVGYTMMEALVGFLIGVGFAYVVAIVFVWIPITRKALFPYAIALKATPLIVLAPLIVLWAGNGFESKAIMASIVAFFPVLVNSLDGLTNVPPERLELMRSLSASTWQVMAKVRIPSSLVFLFSGLKTASSLAVVGAIIGEFTGASRGIGHLVNTSSYYLETDLVFAAILLISLAGLAFFGLVGLCERWVLRWHPSNRPQA